MGVSLSFKTSTRLDLNTAIVGPCLRDKAQLMEPEMSVSNDPPIDFSKHPAVMCTSQGLRKVCQSGPLSAAIHFSHKRFAPCESVHTTLAFC